MLDETDNFKYANTSYKIGDNMDWMKAFKKHQIIEDELMLKSASNSAIEKNIDLGKRTVQKHPNKFMQKVYAVDRAHLNVGRMTPRMFGLLAGYLAGYVEYVDGKQKKGEQLDNHDIQAIAYCSALLSVDNHKMRTLFLKLARKKMSDGAIAELKKFFSTYNGHIKSYAHTIRRKLIKQEEETIAIL